MDSQKNENLLNLALDTSLPEREKSLELNVGYDVRDRTWEVIVKYHGSLQGLREYGIQVEELIAGYAILTVPESEMERLSQSEEIEYVEKPKRLFFSDLQGRSASCFAVGSKLSANLTGKGVLVAVIDSGISYFNNNFRKADGTTRIRYLWDQVLEREFNEEEINEALATGNREAALTLVPSIDPTGHGTAVAGIAAGFDNSGEIFYAGMAIESELLVVRLGSPAPDSFPRTTQLMRALNYVVRKSLELQMPVAINISFGNTYGAHNGTSLLERYMDNLSEIGKSVICVGSGNEAASGGHTSGNVLMQGDGTPVRVELVIGNYERGLNVQLWKEYTDRYRISLYAPSGDSFAVDTLLAGKQVYQLDNTRILLYNGEPAPYVTSQELYFDFLPGDGRNFIEEGIWMFQIEPVIVTAGSYTFYLPTQSVRNAATRFIRSIPDVTLTIPSTASRVITVGAYDTTYESYADFSGRGYAGERNVEVSGIDPFVKPDLVAPGVEITAPDRERGYISVTGTSFATPFVTGAAAILLEWGIVQGRDPYLYGEKVKAYLRKGAKSLRGERIYPNARVGYGALCLQDSLPE